MHEPKEDEEDLGPSKSARKRQMHALQALGESLLELSEAQLNDIPIESETLLTAIAECRGIRTRAARKRHLQLIGKLMREVDATPIEQALQAIHHARKADTDAFHDLEKLRDEMLAAGANGAELAMSRWPDADRRQLRQLLLQHAREQEKSKPAAASRKLFRLLKELQAG